MSSNYEPVKKGVVKRSERRKLGVFIDGINLDRATRRLNKKVDLGALLRGVASGLQPLVARYYTLIPYEDDSRHWAYLDAVHKAGLDVVIKRLPPKGIQRQATIDVEMASDILAFSRGHDRFSAECVYLPENKAALLQESQKSPEPEEDSSNGLPIKRVVTIVCPSKDLSYPIGLAKELGADTVTADFSKQGGDVLKSAAKWIDLSDSETIWM